MAAGDHHSVAIRSDGTLGSWGSDDYGQVTQTPTRRFTAVAAGGYHSVAIKGDDVVFDSAGQILHINPHGTPVTIEGDLHVTGALSKASGTFRIDHPLDPTNKYLQHSFVESPDMMNIYNGEVATDAKGYATVTLPDWFEALNRDFRYQLTVIDTADDDDFVLAKVVSEIRDHRFRIRTSAPHTRVSWQVTGVRQDAVAKANPMRVELDKPEDERGTYLHPEAYGITTARSRQTAKGEAR